MFLSNQRIFSFAWPRAERRKFFIGIQTDTEEPLTFPNVTRNVIAHELGHALGLSTTDLPRRSYAGRANTSCTVRKRLNSFQ